MKTHGEGKPMSPRYAVWCAMLSRCRNPRHKRWKDYGGRGITVCERWYKFENFAADMGYPGPNETLDRKDNDGHYTLLNCRWALQKTQARNRRSNKLTQQQADEIRRRRLNGEKTSSLSREFNIRRDNVCRIAQGVTWA